MAYRDRRPPNWGVLVATILAVPASLVWGVVAVIGGSLVCADENVCTGSTAVTLLGGLLAVTGIAAVIAWSINRVIALIRPNR